MRALLQQISIEVSPQVYQKDPYSSDLGKNLLREGNLLISEIGLEAFTFKKLAHRLGTTESSIYRYFENKHKFLLYLIGWYWGWLEYELVMSTTNITQPSERLTKIIEVLCEPVSKDLEHNLINLQLLHAMVIEESPKAFFTKEVEIDNENGLFTSYKKVVSRLSHAIAESAPHYPYSLSLATTIIETINQQQFLGSHFPKMTNVKKSSNMLFDFIEDMVAKTLKA